MLEKWTLLDTFWTKLRWAPVKISFIKKELIENFLTKKESKDVLLKIHPGFTDFKDTNQELFWLKSLNSLKSKIIWKIGISLIRSFYDCHRKSKYPLSSVQIESFLIKTIHNLRVTDIHGQWKI